MKDYERLKMFVKEYRPRQVFRCPLSLFSLFQPATRFSHTLKFWIQLCITPTASKDYFKFLSRRCPTIPSIETSNFVNAFGPLSCSDYQMRWTLPLKLHYHPFLLIVVVSNAKIFLFSATSHFVTYI
jgi:hypothetical protein